MTLELHDLVLYAGALVILFVTPGPVWLALAARGISSGFAGVWPLALGVSIGDVVWPFLAILGVSWVLTVFADLMDLLRWVALAVFVIMGWSLIRHADRLIGADSRLTRPGIWPGFAAGVAAILGNPKAILFYMGVLPGFFDLGSLTWPDIAVICALSMAVPLAGNLVLGLSMDRVRRLLRSPAALRRTNITAGVLLIVVGLVLPFT